MLTKKAQIVIGIGVIILSAAFLLVGVYFANLQGLFFQNGARSLQLFADNIGFSINSLYGAPSSMTITLAGNNSLCTWDPSISAYTCAGGSKIYNVSYSNGPTLDSGKNVFSVALCFMVGYGFGGVGNSKGVVKDGVGEAEQITREEATTEVDSILQEQAQLSEAALSGELTGDLEDEGIAPASSLAAKLKSSIKDRIITDIKHPLVQDLPPESLLSSSLSSIRESLPSLTIFIPTAVASLSAALVAVPLVELWFGTSSSNLNTYVTRGIYINGQQIGALTGPSVSISQQIAAAYLTQEPMPFKYAAADFVLQQYSQLLSSEQTLNSLPSGLGKDTLTFFASKQVAIKQDVLSELSNAANIATSNNPYGTPVSGVSAPGVLSSSSSLIGSVALSQSGSDPLLSIPFFLAQNAFLVYARTASCLSLPAQPLNTNNYNSVGKGFSSLSSELGAATTLINVYDKVNSVLPLGTYFVGYGGEVYLNGQSSGRPTQVTSPLITDMNDMCELATTASQPGQNLKTLIQPSGNGSISFSISQGLYNTICSTNNALFPNTLQTELNNLFNSKSSTQNVTLLLPPGDSLVISNQKNNVNLCIYRMLIDSFGSPVMDTNGFNNPSFNVTEYGSPLSCVNMTNLSRGMVNIGLTSTELSVLNNMLHNTDFYVNNGSLIGFSVPVLDFPNQLTADSAAGPNSFLSAGNFIGGGQPVLKKDLGIDFPVASLISSLIGKSIPKLQVGISTSLDNFLVSPMISLSAYNTNLSYYETDYSNVTLEFTKTQLGSTTDYNIINVYNTLIFGVYPNNANSFGGTYLSGG
ncbi:MAG: hypothetical protein M1322_02535 [Candidatus Parvarchaeota archaeon]|jgi:hypothetical protein|nr:hypothetical protein [Candidatus Parvarchaeota archaeon]MCL5106966.1 hypothetical protein [Candidatus Parvarchaeota archaeon]